VLLTPVKLYIEEATSLEATRVDSISFPSRMTDAARKRFRPGDHSLPSASTGLKRARTVPPSSSLSSDQATHSSLFMKLAERVGPMASGSGRRRDATSGTSTIPMASTTATLRRMISTGL
jgi:hypothetical protein